MKNYRPNTKLSFCRFGIAKEAQSIIGKKLFMPNDSSELDDLTVFVPDNFRAVIPANTTLHVKITDENPDKFEYWFGSIAPEGTHNCSATPLNIEFGLAIQFEETTGHEAGDQWDIPIYAYAAHERQRLNDSYIRNVVAALPTIDPRQVDIEENRISGGAEPTNVSISGIDTGFPVEIPRASIQDIYNFLVMTLNLNNRLISAKNNFGGISPSVLFPNNEDREMRTRSIGYRIGKEMTWHRLYGMAPRSLAITFPVGAGGFCRLTSAMAGVGKHDMLPVITEKISGQLNDSTLTLSDEVLDDSLTHVRKVIAIDEDGKRYVVQVLGLDSQTLSIVPLNDNPVSCTYHVMYVKKDDVAADTWAGDIETFQEPEYVPIKSTNLTDFVIGGHIKKETLAGLSVVNGEKLRCDLRGDITLEFDPRASTIVCADGIDDNAANMIITRGAKTSITFSRLVYDLFYQWVAERPESVLAEFPLMFSYVTAMPGVSGNKVMITVIIPRMKLTNANPTAMDGEIGHTLMPVILDSGGAKTEDDKVMPPILIRIARAGTVE